MLSFEINDHGTRRKLDSLRQRLPRTSDLIKELGREQSGLLRRPSAEGIAMQAQAIVDQLVNDLNRQ